MKKNDKVMAKTTWMRVFRVLFFAILFQILELALALVVGAQLLSKLFTGRSFDELSALGGRMARYTQDIVAYITFHSEKVPFPFDLPESEEKPRRDEPGDSFGEGPGASCPLEPRPLPPV